MQPGASSSRRASGFTLLEVLIAVAILSVSLTSLLWSQMMALRATRYAQGVTAVAFLAEQQLLEIEWELRRDGWSDFDQEFEGDFSELGWSDVTYTCIVDKIELPEYTQIQAAVDAAGENDGGDDGGSDNVMDTGEQAFGMLGMVWGIIKSAIEESIRKATCTAYWKDGKVTHDVQVATFWTDMNRLNQLPALGGETGDEASDDGQAAQSGGRTSGAGGGSRGRVNMGGPVRQRGGGR